MGCYLHTFTLKSKDIDITTNLETLHYLSKKYHLKKNESLKKYEINKDGISIDIYVEHYSKLCIDIKKIIKNYI